MIHVVEQVDVAAAAAVTWAAVTDWASQGEWMLGTSVRVTGGDGQAVGSTLAAFTGVGPLGFTDHMQITAWEPPHRCVVRHTGRVVRGTGVFEVVDRGAAASTFVWRETLRPPLGRLGDLGWLVLGPAFRLGLRESLRRLAARAEALA
ncbi:SRPBCC family protein [Actinokineospora auranticolor]|uniref:Polyketide cyclase/dehydrase/lipid transport protein n=1 Tax=Actinokineospora auranticolor TaxID=155976 RepID=A0A2S6GY45_9PSEU|nr:SRPBCC family protein [Actinokineospora auranticolor]PPK70149.1 polyketide cyclase/dehydrase/lipid transport protein [Actinokineospora auranticolor]